MFQARPRGGESTEERQAVVAQRSSPMQTQDFYPILSQMSKGVLSQIWVYDRRNKQDQDGRRVS